MSLLEVELPDLRAYADLVGRAATDCVTIGADSEANIRDGDFGRMLSLVTNEYEAFLGPAHAVMSEDGRRLGQTGEALRVMAHDFAVVDQHVAERFADAGVGPRSRGSARFPDVAPISLRCLAVPAATLPSVDFGFPFDQICDLAVSIGLWDIRARVTSFLVGDVAKALSHAAYWEMYATNLSNVEANLAYGATKIADTWRGRSADKVESAARLWTASLGEQSGAMHKTAEHLHGIVSEAMGVAQVVVDAVKFFISMVSAGWSYAYLPIFGEIKLVNKIRDAWQLIVKAYKALTLFWAFARVLGDGIREAVTTFTTADLPAAPHVSGA